MSINIEACQPQSDIEAAYNAWVAGFTYSGGCSSTDNIASIPALPADAYDNGANLSFTYTVDNLCSPQSCTSTFVVEPDTIPPTFTADPYENCVDPLQYVIYNESNPNPYFNQTDPNLEKDPSPDHRTMYAGDTFLDLTSLEDNCCDSLSMVDNIHWRIDFQNTIDPITGATIVNDPIIGTGQPSTYGSDIQLWGDGVNYTTLIHTITYWVEDCHGNVSEELVNEIKITPRPQIIKQY